MEVSLPIVACDEPFLFSVVATSECTESSEPATVIATIPPRKQLCIVNIQCAVVMVLLRVQQFHCRVQYTCLKIHCMIFLLCSC